MNQYEMQNPRKQYPQPEFPGQPHEALGGIDILVNIAGRQTAVPDIADRMTKQFEATFRTNVSATFGLCKAALPHMPPGASIINTASIQSYRPSPTLLDYASSKAAITAFTHALAKQVISKGIRVNAVAPGPIRTPLQPGGGQPARRSRTSGRWRRWGAPASRRNGRRSTCCSPPRSPAS
jgi:NAD(P)-dependent dehydrogenase (short-subunit alcohol dehydrogenase family)